MTSWQVIREYGRHWMVPERIQCVDESAAREQFARKVIELHQGRVLLLDPEGQMVLKATAHRRTA